MKTANEIALILNRKNQDNNVRYVAVNGKVCLDEFDHGFNEFTTVKTYSLEEIADKAVERGKADAEKLGYVDADDLALIPIHRWNEVA